jgi:predicted transcriptional regulator
VSADKKPEISQYNIEGKELEAFLGPLEASVMEAVWTCKRKPMTVREIHEVLKKDKKLAYTTIMSTMNRLHEKGILDRRIEKGKGGLYYVYWPVLEEKNFKESAIREVIKSLVSNFGGLATNALIEETTSKNKEKSEKEKANKKKKQ